jgi:hypothetical protein
MKHFVLRAVGVGTTVAAAAGLLAGTAGAAEAAGPRISVVVCADGNYTAYAKVVAQDGSFNQSLHHAPAGACWTNSVQLNTSASINVFLFGIYNVSHKGFDVCDSGGPAIGGNPTARQFQNLVLRAGGTTTDPFWGNDPVSAPC